MKLAALLLPLLFCVQSNEELRKELLAMGEIDQKIQLDQNLNPLSGPDHDAKQVYVFVQNTKRLREIIRTQGFPTAAQVGKDGMKMVFLIIQHSDFAPEFQEKCLPTFRKMAMNGEIPKQDYAYLFDRIRVNTGRKQLYGSQLAYDKDANPYPKPVEDPKNLDKRRAEMGMSTEQEYLDVVKAFQRDMKKKLEKNGGS